MICRTAKIIHADLFSRHTSVLHNTFCKIYLCWIFRNFFQYVSCLKTYLCKTSPFLTWICQCCFNLWQCPFRNECYPTKQSMYLTVSLFSCLSLHIYKLLPIFIILNHFQGLCLSFSVSYSLKIQSLLLPNIILDVRTRAHMNTLKINENKPKKSNVTLIWMAWNSFHLAFGLAALFFFFFFLGDKEQESSVFKEQNAGWKGNFCDKKNLIAHFIY